MSDAFGSLTQQNILTGGDGAKLYGWYAENTSGTTVFDVNNASGSGAANCLQMTFPSGGLIASDEVVNPGHQNFVRIFMDGAENLYWDNVTNDATTNSGSGASSNYLREIAQAAGLVGLAANVAGMSSKAATVALEHADTFKERLRNALMGGPIFTAAYVVNPFSYMTEGKPSEGAEGTTIEPPEGAATDLQAGLDKMNALDEQLGYAQTPEEQTPEDQTQNEGQSSSSAPEGQQTPTTEPQTPEGKAEAEAAPESYAALKELHYPDDEIVDMDAGRARDIIDNEIPYKPEPVNETVDWDTSKPDQQGAPADWPSLEAQLKALGYSNEEMDGMSLNDARSIVESQEQLSAEEGQRQDIQKQLEALGVKSEPETAATATPEQVIYTTRVGNRYVKEKLEFDEAMGKLFDAVDNKDNTLHRVIYDEVSDDTAEKMRQSAKDSNADIDVSGYRHLVRNSTTTASQK